MTQRLDLIQQYAGTTGHCHLWAMALREVLPDGYIARLRTTDPEILERHDWPPGMEFVLHNFLVLEKDGHRIAVDAEGAHSMDEMIGKFGFRRRNRFAIDPDPDYSKPLDQPPGNDPAAVRAAVELRIQVLQALGWEPDRLPPYNGELDRKWKAIARQAMREGVPEPSIPEPAPKPGLDF